MTEKVYIFAKTYDDRPNTDRVFSSGPYPWRVIDAALQGRIDALPADQVTELTALRDVPGQISDLAALITTANVAYLTKSAMDADTAQPGGTLALVFDDGTPANNGLYVFTAGSPGSWAKTELQLANATDLAGRADAAITITGAGAATGGGTLEANRVIDVPIASEAEAQAGTNAAKVMTPQRATDHLNQRRGASNGVASLNDSGVVPDGQISAASVKQHEAELELDFNQISEVSNPASIEDDTFDLVGVDADGADALMMRLFGDRPPIIPGLTDQPSLDVDESGTIEDDPLVVTAENADGDEVTLARFPSFGAPTIPGLEANASSPEVEAARGERDSLDLRLSEALDDYGLPVQSLLWPHRMREARMRLRRILLGDAAQWVLAVIGDSWSNEPDGYTRKLAQTLIDTYGDAGAGWLGFAMTGAGNINGGPRSDVTVTRTGTWTEEYNFANTPDLGNAVSSDTGAEISIDFPAGHTGCDLYYTPTADGVIRYRWNGGSWISLTLSGSGMQVVSLTAPAITDTLMEIQPTAGTVKLGGVDLKSTATGVRVHTTCSSGSTTATWVAPNETQWKSGLAALAPHSVIILLGVNDALTEIAPATSKANLQVLINRVRSALPGCDIMIMAAPNIPATPSFDLSDYTPGFRQLAALNDCAFLDLQETFGVSPSDYAHDSGRPWLRSDGIHPAQATGGAAIANAVLQSLQS